jgi:hypothetical protein
MLVDPRTRLTFMDIHADIMAKAEELRLALRAKLGVRGREFPDAVKSAGRLLPNRLRKQAGVIVKAQGLGGNPKLMRMVDMAGVNKAHSDISEFLAAINPKERRRTRILRWFGGLAFNLIVVATCFVIWLVWSGNL